MKLYQSIGPNPHVVRMFLAEKGIDIPMETIDIRAGVNRQSEFLKLNPMGQSPALLTDKDAVITEILAICEYIEELHPTPPLIGTNADERGETRMWTRRIDLNIVDPLSSGFRYSDGIKMFESRMRVIPEAAGGLKALAQDGFDWLNSQMGNNIWVCGNRFTLADILLFCFVVFGNRVGQPLSPNHQNLTAWFNRVETRTSSQA